MTGVNLNSISLTHGVVLFLLALIVCGWFDWVGSAVGSVAGWVSGAASSVAGWVGSAVSTVTSIVGKAGSEIGTVLGTVIGGPAGAGIGRALGGALEGVFSKTEEAAAAGKTLSPAEIRAEIERELPISFSPVEAQATISAIMANPDIPSDVKAVICEVINERTIRPSIREEIKPGGCAAKEAFGG